MSSKAVFEQGKAIRGGVPLVFPQFGGGGALPSHGFARINDWHVESAGEGKGGSVEIVLKLGSGDKLIPENLKTLWPGEFELGYTMILDAAALTIRFQVQNKGSYPLQFENALHTYFRVDDITKTVVPGLVGLTYLDNMKKRESGKEIRQKIPIDCEIDRVYVNAPDKMEIHDLAAGRAIIVEKRRMQDGVLWNPWIEKAKALSDLGDEDYKQFVCLEAGNVSRKVELAAGENWECEQKLSFRKI
jgi:glucose-6-phosphate 1-epimerase